MLAWKRGGYQVMLLVCLEGCQREEVRTCLVENRLIKLEHDTVNAFYQC